MNHNIKSSLYLILTAFIWGMGFVAQRSGMEYVGPFFFNGFRMLLGFLTLIIFLRVYKGRTSEKQEKAIPRLTLIKCGTICGLLLFAGSMLQQIGIVYTTASKAGFITALYIVLVPMFGLFLKHRIRWNAWLSVAIAAVGLYFLCMNAEYTVEPGDLIVMLSAIFWASHILVINQYAPYMDAIRLSSVQFAVSGILSLLIGIFADQFFAPPLTMEMVVNVLPTLLYAGVLSSGVGFTLQIVGQKHANPTAAALILSLEAVFAVLGGFVLLGESMSVREVLGCVLMFSAVVLAQAPVKQSKSA